MEQRPGRGVPHRRWLPARGMPRVVAALVRLVAVVDLGSALLPAQRGRLAALTALVPLPVVSVAAATTACAGILLLLLASGLRRRKRRAWLAVTALLVLTTVLHLLKGLDVEEAAASIALLVVLVLTRREFRASSDERSCWHALWLLAVLLPVAATLGLLLLVLNRDDIVGPLTLRAAILEVLSGLVGTSGPISFDTGRAGSLIAATLAGLGLLTAVVPAYVALRSARRAGQRRPEDEQRLRALLDRYGDRDSLGYFALRGDKSVVWSPSGKAGVAYRVVSGVALASGDPIGDPEAWPGAIDAFLAVVAAHAWVPAVLGCSEQAGTAYRRKSLDALELGDEAVVDAATFSLDGRAMRGVRQAVARIERAGYRARVARVRDLPPEELAQLAAFARACRGTQTERGFSMALGRVGDGARDGDCVLAIAEQETETGVQPRALLQFAPWGSTGLSLDLMLRERGSDNGLNEFLIAAAIRAAPALGIRRLSLNFAVFRSALERGERLGAGPVLRAWRGVLLIASRWWQIESLYRFNAKFRPEWVPRFVCFAALGDLPRIAMAALEAEAFLVWPWLRGARR
jgi:lysyl-tRNA synthetase class 2